MKFHIVNALYNVGDKRGELGNCNIDTSMALTCWTNRGGDFDPTELASVSLDGLTMGDTVKVDITDLVTAYLDSLAAGAVVQGFLGKFENDGVIEDGDSYEVLFYTSQEADTSRRPWIEGWVTRYGEEEGVAEGIKVTRSLGSVGYFGRGVTPIDLRIKTYGNAIGFRIKKGG